MSSGDRRNEGESADRRLIREAKEEAWHARRALRRELPNPSVGAKHDLACALDDYRDLLYDYHDERALDTPWDEREVDVDALGRLLTETTTRVQQLDRRGSPRKTRTVQKVADADPQLLFDIAKELDAIAKELGFAASADDPTPQEEADMSDLRGLLKARGQTEALRHLPEGDDGKQAATDGGEK